MDYDFYICKELVIYFTKGRNDFMITLDKYHGFFSNKDTKQNDLNPKIPPIVIYENGLFKTSFVAEKYKSLIEKELLYNNLHWRDIVKIVKEERRYERE